MAKVSIVVPSRNELFLQKTVTDLLTKASGDIEVIAVLDGYWQNPPLEEDKRLIQIHHGKPLGLRAAINAGFAVGKGEYLMKCDAHCMFGEGYDEILQADCDDDWIAIPRRHSLNAEEWAINPKRPVDYMYIECPDGSVNRDLAAKVWMEKNRDESLKEILIDDLLSFQGSCWFMPIKLFKRIGPMDEYNYGTFRKEPQEIGFKTWLSGGRVVRNKKTWYAHLHKGKQYGRGYRHDSNDYLKGDLYNGKWLTDSAWDERQTLKFRWLMEKFMPMPGWENFKW